MRREVGRAGLVGLVTAVCLVLFSMAMTVADTRVLNENSGWVQHTNTVMLQLEELLSLVKDAETGQRGYLLTGTPEYLEPYTAATQGIAPRLAKLGQLIEDNPQQQDRLVEVRRRVGAKLEELRQTIVLRQSGRADEAMQTVLGGRGKAEMDALRVAIANMRGEEERLLGQRGAAETSAYHRALFFGLFSGVAALLAIWALLRYLRRYVRLRDTSESALAAEAEKFRTTLLSIGDAVITTDTERKVTSLNAIAEALTGWGSERAVGKPLEAIFRIVNEATRAVVESPVVKSLRVGAIVGLANHTVLLREDGSEIPIDDSAAPIRTAEGAITGCVLVFRDVTERKRIETDLRVSEERRRLALNAAELGAWNIDPAKRVLLTDERFGTIFTGSPVPLSYSEAERAVHVDDRSAVSAAIAASIRPQDPAPYAIEYRVVHPDGTVRWVYAKGSANFVGEGSERRLVSFDGTVADITVRRQAEEDLRRVAAGLSEADRRKDEFLATLAHELRNPLAAIRTGLEVVARSPGDSQRAQRVVAMVDRQSQVLVKLVDDLMDVSRVATGKVMLNQDQIDLRSVLELGMEGGQTAFDASRHDVRLELPPGPVWVRGDTTRLAQVVGNLVNNAGKYTPDGGRITISLHQEGSEAVLRISDTGAGIPPEQLDQVFEMFSQVDRTLDRARGGLGIGLSLVRRLVELHGGTVSADSMGVGKGSTFTVRFPAIDDSVPGLAKDHLPPATPKPTRQLRILVVDDNQDVADGLAALLESEGHEVRTAYDGARGLNEVIEFAPDIVFCDMGMPGMSGHELARAVRSKQLSKMPLLVAVSGWGSEEDRRLTLAAGFDVHCTKPISGQDVDSLLARFSS